MKVCVLTEFFFPDNLTGTGNVVSDLARRLKDESGLEVYAITGRPAYHDPNKNYDRFEDWNGINIYRVSAPGWNRSGTALRTVGNWLLTFGALWKLLTMPKPDVVFVTSAPPFLVAATSIAKKLRKIPFVYCIYDMEPDRVLGLGVMAEGSLFVRLMHWFQNKSVKTADRVLVIGQCMSDRLQRVYSLPKSQIAVIPIGAAIDAEEAQSDPAQSAKYRGDATFVLLYSGNFGKYHDFNSILDAAKNLEKDAPHMKFVLVGGGAQRQHVEDRVANEKISNVELLSFVSDEEYPHLLGAADACLVTMEKGLEGTCVPSKFYAYLGAGSPSVAVVDKTCEIALTIEEVKCGVVVTQGDSEELTRAIRSLAENPEQVKTMAKNAKAAGAGAYSRSATTTRIKELLSEVAKR